MATQEEYKSMSAAEQKKEDWMNSKWRPAMGWLYMSVCAFDFVIFPILWSLVQALHGGQVTNQWQPLTLQGAGLFHIAMGAVLGLAAYGRTQEKVAGANNGGLALPSGPVGTSYTPPAPTPQAPPAAFTPPPVVAKTVVATPVITASGKPGPAPAPEPEL